MNTLEENSQKLVSWVQNAMNFIFGLLIDDRQTEFNASFDKNPRYISSGNTGFAIGSKRFNEALSFEGLGCYGSSGSGKTSSVILNTIASIARGGASLCINDPSKQIWQAISALLTNFGYLCIPISFGDPAISWTFNELVNCRSSSDIYRLAVTIVKNALGSSDSKTDVFWDRASEMLISVMGRYLVFHRPIEYRTFANVLSLVERFAIDSESVNIMFAKTNDDDLIQSYKNFLAMSSNTLTSVVANTRAALSIFADENVKITTATNTLDFSLLRKRKTAIFVSTGLQQQYYMRSLSAMLFQTLFDYLLAEIPKKDEKSVFVILEELSTMRIPELDKYTANARKFRCGILACVQDEKGLDIYGTAQAHQIKSNLAIKCYLRGQNHTSADMISKMLGKFSWDDKHGKHTKNLMEPDAVRQTDDAIVFVANKKPLKFYPVPFYKNPQYSRWSKLLPLVIKPKPIILPPNLQF